MELAKRGKVAKAVLTQEKVTAINEEGIKKVLPTLKLLLDL